MRGEPIVGSVTREKDEWRWGIFDFLSPPRPGCKRTSVHKRTQPRFMVLFHFSSVQQAYLTDPGGGMSEITILKQMLKSLDADICPGVKFFNSY